MSFKSSFALPAVAALGFYFIGGTLPAYADLGDQLAKLPANDGADEDQFGASVAISANASLGVSHLLDSRANLVQGP